MSNAYQRFVERIARTPLGAKIFIPVATAVDRFVIRVSGGRLTSGVGTTWGGKICLLKTTGAKTGKLRTVPLLVTEVGDDVVLIASQGGAPRSPGWYHNLKKNPECEIELRGERSRRRAREAEADERDRLWAAARAVYPGYDEYQNRTTRRIPVMVLERI